MLNSKKSSKNDVLQDHTKGVIPRLFLTHDNNQMKYYEIFICCRVRSGVKNIKISLVFIWWLHQYHGSNFGMKPIGMIPPLALKKIYQYLFRPFFKMALLKINFTRQGSRKKGLFSGLTPPPLSMAIIFFGFYIQGL